MSLSRGILLLLLLSPIAGAVVQAQSFKENKGQWPEQVTFLTELGQADVYIEKNGLTFDLSHPDDLDQIGAAHHMKEVEFPESIRHHAYRLTFENANADPIQRGQIKLPGEFNYFIGNEPDKWGTNVSAYSHVQVESVYDGIDIEYYFSEGQLKYDFIVNPEADPSEISILYSGVNPRVDKMGNLVIGTSVNEVIEQRPYAYQFVDGKQVEVECRYRMRGTLQFVVGEYDRSSPLFIDPIVKFSTYSGSFSDNFGYTATFDKFGFLYSGSSIFGPDYPTVEGSYDIFFNNGVIDMAISKYDSTGTFMVYSTYIGGSSNELPHSIIVNEEDELIILGTTDSDDFPVSDQAYDITFAGGDPVNLSGLGAGYDNGSDIILAKLSSAGDDLLSATYIGGSGNDGLNLATVTNFNYADEIRGEVDLDAGGNILVATCSHIVGQANDFPITAGAIDAVFSGGNQEGVIFKMSPDMQNLIWSTYFGGNGQDAALSITTNSNGDVIVSGGTSSTDLPTTTGVLHEEYIGGIGDAYVVVISEDGQSIISCSYWGTTERDQAYMVELDAEDNIHLFGQTWGGDNLIINAGFSNANSGQFISKLDSLVETVVWSTTFGTGSGQPDISPTAFSVDICNRVYLSGWGGPVQGADLTTFGLETTNDAFQSSTDGGDFYLLAMADDASELVYASFFGGGTSNEHVDGGTSRFDKKGKVYQSVCAGCGGNSDFPTLPVDVVSHSNNSPNCNNAVFKMDFELPAVIADFFAEPVCANEEVEFLNTSLGGLTFDWDFGDNTVSELFEPTHTYGTPGFYEVSLLVQDPLSCNLADSISFFVEVLPIPELILDTLTVCADASFQLGPSDAMGLSYLWDNDSLLNSTTISNPTASIEQTTIFMVELDNGSCSSFTEQVAVVEPLELQWSNDTLICDGDPVSLTATSLGTSTSYQWSNSPDFSNVLTTDSTYTFTPIVTTTLFVETGDLCTKTGEVTVTVSSDQLSFSQNNYVCADDTISISLTNQFPEIDIDILWSPDAPLISGQGTESIEVAVDTDTWFAADVTNEFGCEIRDSVLVEISPLSFETITATADVYEIPLGGEATITAEPGSGYTYQWVPPTGLSNPNGPVSLASPPGTTTYTIQVVDEDINGSCILTDTVQIKVFEFLCEFPVAFLPNSFSPDNDGVNDLLYVRGPYVESIELSIYDRWGEKVFETNDLTVPWDGTYEGRELDPDVYVYHLTLICIDGQETFEKGNITLIR